MMKHWKTRTLGEVARITAGDPAPQRSEDFVAGGIPFVRMQDVGRLGRTSCLTQTKDRLTPAASAKLKLVPAGAILVPKSGASIRLNHRAILGVDANVVSHLAIIIPNELLDRRFAYYWLCKTDLSNVAHQADLPSMKISDLAKLEMPVPSLEEQARIVQLLDAASGLLEKRAQADRRIAAIVPALFEDVIGKLSDIEKRWPMRALGEMIAFGPQNGLYKHSSSYGSGTPILRIDAFYDGEVKDLSELKRLRLSNDEVEHYRLREDDIVVNRVNSPEYLGKSALIPALAEPTVFESNMMRFSLAADRLDPRYFISFMQTPFAKRHILSRAKHAINQSSINQDDLKSLLVPVPPLSLQRDLADRLAGIGELKVMQSSSRIRLSAFFDSMLGRAFSQEL